MSLIEGATRKTRKTTCCKGVWLEDEYKRMYPFDTLASSVIGFTNKNADHSHWNRGILQ